MKLFEKFDAVRFPEENLLFITRDEYIYYIYNPKYNYWRKHRNAGNDHITVSNYPDASEDELIAATGGKRPEKETDFMRLCQPAQLCIRDMLDLFDEDYPSYMADYHIRHTAHRVLLESDISYKSYLKLRTLFDGALAEKLDHQQVIKHIKKLSFDVIGRDIFKPEIGIVDGHDSSSYFWIMPVRIVDDETTDSIDNVAEMRSNEISIEEDDVAQYLTPFLYKYFDDELDANKKRIQDRWIDDDGVEHSTSVSGFEWYLTYNFYTYEAMQNILNDIHDTLEALSTGKENEYMTIHSIYFIADFKHIYYVHIRYGFSVWCNQFAAEFTIVYGNEFSRRCFKFCFMKISCFYVVGSVRCTAVYNAFFIGIYIF